MGNTIGVSYSWLYCMPARELLVKMMHVDKFGPEEMKEYCAFDSRPFFETPTRIRAGVFVFVDGLLAHKPHLCRDVEMVRTVREALRCVDVMLVERSFHKDNLCVECGKRESKIAYQQRTKIDECPSAPSSVFA